MKLCNFITTLFSMMALAIFATACDPQSPTSGTPVPVGASSDACGKKLMDYDSSAKKCVSCSTGSEYVFGAAKCMSKCLDDEYRNLSFLCVKISPKPTATPTAKATQTPKATPTGAGPTPPAGGGSPKPAGTGGGFTSTVPTVLISEDASFANYWIPAGTTIDVPADEADSLTSEDTDDVFKVTLGSAAAAKFGRPTAFLIKAHFSNAK